MTTAVSPKKPGIAPKDGDADGNGEGRICCPLCKWTPQAHHWWMCTCRHMWNTFDTGGVCPKSLYQWRVTQCLSCRGLSAHSDWYPKR
jgi:hypothetical protein